MPSLQKKLAVFYQGFHVSPVFAEQQPCRTDFKRLIHNLLPDPLRYRWPPHGRFTRTWRCFNGRAQEEVVGRRRLVRRGRILKKNCSAINKGERIGVKEEPTGSQKPSETSEKNWT